MFYLVLMKAKVGASWCDLYYTYSSFSVHSISIFWNWVGFEKEKKRHTQAFQFLQLVVHMYFVPVKLFILEIKEKKSILEKKNCLASQCGLALTRSRVWPLGGVKQFFFLYCFVFVSKRCLILILLRYLHFPHFANQFQFRGGWDPLNRGKFHVSICAVHIV